MSVRVLRNRIPAVRASITDRSVDTVRDNATFLRDYAQSIAPVDTGAFRSSMYVNMNAPGKESDYPQAVDRALSLNPRANIIPELDAANLDINVGRNRNALGQFTLPEAIVSSAVEYAAYLEDGTVHMAPRPTFRQAALAAESRFRNDMTRVADGF